MELLSHPSLEEVSVMIVFSKLDRQAARQLHELKTLMRLEQIVGGGNNDVSQVRRVIGLLLLMIEEFDGPFRIGAFLN